MDSWAKLIEALATLIWPILVLTIVFRFTPVMRELIESAKSRRVTVKIGGHELTIGEISEQQSNLIADLQAQVSALREAVGTNNVLSNNTDFSVDKVDRTPPAVLWVDDRPKNNSWFVGMLNAKGIDVDEALTTAEGLELFDKGNYRLVISDIGRKEEGEYKQRAGLELLSAIRAMDDKIPVALFTSDRGVRAYSQKAADMGATLTTASGTELTELLRKNLPEWSA